LIYREHRHFPVPQRRINLFDIVEHVSLGHEKVIPPIVVEIFETYTPTRTPAGEHAQASLQAPITERSTAFVVINTVNLTRQLGHDNVGPPVVIVILKYNSHSGESSTVL